MVVKELSRGRLFAEMKSKGENAFKKNEYLTAIYYYSMANEDLSCRCNHLVQQAPRLCRMLMPECPKACYRKGAAHSLLKDYAGAADAFLEGLTLDRGNEEIEKALWEAVESMKKLHSYCWNQRAAKIYKLYSQRI